MVMTQALSLYLADKTKSPDYALMQRINRGDEDALREIFATHGNSMYAYALQLIGDPTLAEESVQQSLVAAWQSAGRYRGEGSLISWLLGIVHHKSLNILRKREDVSLDAMENPMPARDETPSRQVENRDIRVLIMHGMDQLSVDQRSVLELVFFHHLSIEDTGRVVGCPTGTVKSRLFAAKSSLKKILSRQGFSAEDLL